MEKKVVHVVIVTRVPHGISPQESYARLAESLESNFQLSGLEVTKVDSSEEAKDLLQSSGGVVLFLSDTQLQEAKGFLEDKYFKIKPLFFTGGQLRQVVCLPKDVTPNTLVDVIKSLGHRK
jgi:hypothetical protein